MKTLAVVIGFLVILVLLVSSGVLAGSLCLESVGCVYSSDGGISIDNSQTVTVTTGD